ncbi:MAG: [acyl-carrier-protein] S-malonyltransferase [Actinomycetota bacterium]|nr:[acyl-carrier-protein] S-malonyltransferase [Actinomycetota bacterium]
MRVGLFPGQGVQPSIVLETLSSRHKLLKRADEILEMDLRRRVEIAARGSAAALPTWLAQPAIFVSSMIGWEAAQPADVQFFAGHSLGEYAALVSSGAVDFEQALQTVRSRGEAMQDASRRAPGGMAAVLGLSLSNVSEIAQQAGVSVANDNAPGQVVLSGSDAGLTKAAGMVVAAGGRSVLLDVAGAFHTSAMLPAVEPFRRALEQCDFTMPSTPVISNVTARPYTSPDEIRSLLLDQLTGSVRFRESLEWLWGKGIREYQDFGPGQVVAGLCKRTFRALETSRAAVYA